MTSDVLHRAADKLTQKPGCGCAKRQAQMNAVIPKSGDAVAAVASAAAKVLRGSWTRPPHAPDGWTLERECEQAMLFVNGGKQIVWSVLDGQYVRSHTFCCGNPAPAIREYESRCQRS